MAKAIRSPLIPILALFLAFQGLYHAAGVNPVARLATLAAMVERQTFEISPYIMPLEWTHDWARTPDSRYFSNKAPGPMLLAFPVYWVWDKLFVNANTPEARDLQRFNQATLSLWVLSLLFQTLPLVIVSWLLARKVGALSQSLAAESWTFAALLMGTSITFYVSSFFGHAVAAAALLWTARALWERKFALAGFAFSLAFLSDYSGMFLAGPFALALWVAAGRGQRGRALLHVALAALPAAALWIWYHTACFGKPWELPLMHQNPGFQDVAGKDGNLWGIAFPFPRPIALFEMFFGGGKGMLKSQPWVLAVLGWGLWNFRTLRRERPPLLTLLILGGVGLVALIYMNASFNSWDGGMAPGLRYISPGLPAFAVMAGALWTRYPAGMRKALVWLIVPSLVYMAWYWAWRTSSPWWHMAKHTWGEAPFRAFQMTLNFGLLSIAALWWRARFKASARTGTSGV